MNMQRAWRIIIGCSAIALTANIARADRGADFNGDGFDDLVVGVPEANVGAVYDAGAVHVIYGSANGLSASGSQRWSLVSAGIPGYPLSDDKFGNRVAWGDFNGDDFDDLAVSINRELGDQGAVYILFGSDSGLTSNSVEFWNLDSPGIEGEWAIASMFGWSLAANDFNGDGRDDLAIGARRAVGIAPNHGHGLVYVLHGTDTGLSAENAQVWHQDVDGLEGESHPGVVITTIDDDGERESYTVNVAWGLRMSTGDYNADGFGDLAVTAYDNGADGIAGGAVNIIYGSADGLTTAGNQYFDQDSPLVQNWPEDLDRFGEALASADFNGDGADDLAIGAPGEDSGVFTDHGVVHVLFGTPTGLTAADQAYWHLDEPSVLGDRKSYDNYGASLIGADFDHDGFADLAIGVPNKNSGSIAAAGAVSVLFGASFGLSSLDDQLIRQATPEQQDHFARSLGWGDYNGDGRADLAVSAPREDFNGVSNAGIINVFYGRASGLKTTSQNWHPNRPGISGSAASNDQFGNLR